jgi:hypothetical protein
MVEIYSMASRQGNRKDTTSGPQRHPEPLEDDDAGGRLPAFPDLMRRAVALGLSGFFFTEETIRKALGETVPKDWTDFAVDQSERTRKEFLERLSFEIAQTLEKVDVANLLTELLEGRTLEVKAEIRLGAKTAEPGGQEIHATIKSTKERE